MIFSNPTSLLRAFLLTALTTSLFLGACKEDEPAMTKVYGTITIDNADIWASWVDSGDVELTIFPAFSLNPLAGWGAVPDGFFGPNAPGGTFAVGAPYNSQNPVVLTYTPGKSRFDYEIELEPGTYSALALGFRHKFINDPTLKSATLGVHWGTPDQVSHGVVIRVPGPNGSVIPVFNYPAPLTFQVAEGEEKRIDFKADFDFVNKWYQ